MEQHQPQQPSHQALPLIGVPPAALKTPKVLPAVQVHLALSLFSTPPVLHLHQVRRFSPAAAVLWENLPQAQASKLKAQAPHHLQVSRHRLHPICLVLLHRLWFLPHHLQHLPARWQIQLSQALLQAAFNKCAPSRKIAVRTPPAPQEQHLEVLSEELWKAPGPLEALRQLMLL